ncbi:MAG: hypothetical protein ACMXYK_05520 [Candidatus Woesearchaeota archaeon]
MRAAGDTQRGLNSAAMSLDNNLRQDEMQEREIETLTRQQRKIDNKEIADVSELDAELLRIEKDLANILGLNKPESAKKKKADKKDIQRQLKRIEKAFTDLVQQEKRERDYLQTIANLAEKREAYDDEKRQAIKLVLDSLEHDQEIIKNLEQLLTQVFLYLSKFFRDGEVINVKHIHEYIEKDIIPLSKKLQKIEENRIKLMKKI